ncbi:MAG: hypothetical protein M3176_18495 [Chloroflexota bacterium]|nr:hypothetical protein [Chloroflexota bacterium]MDQ6908811.1 hypothetical protein [Chloroflexota bacterium]
MAAVVALVLCLSCRGDGEQIHALHEQQRCHTAPQIVEKPVDKFCDREHVLKCREYLVLIERRSHARGEDKSHVLPANTREPTCESLSLAV